MIDAPAVALEGADTTSREAAAALTVMGLVVPVILLVVVSVTVTVWLPADLSVTETVSTPAVRVVLAGNTACVSVLVKWTVPAYPVAVLPKASRAVIVTLNADPAVALPGADTAKCVAADAPTTSVVLPVIVEVVVSVAVSVRLPDVSKVAENVPTPLVNVLFAGKVAWGSPLVKWTVPAYPVAVFP